MYRAELLLDAIRDLDPGHDISLRSPDELKAQRVVKRGGRRSHASRILHHTRAWRLAVRVLTRTRTAASKRRLSLLASSHVARSRALVGERLPQPRLIAHTLDLGQRQPCLALRQQVASEHHRQPARIEPMDLRPRPCNAFARASTNRTSK